MFIKRNKKLGFTLVELMVYMAIFALVFGTLILFFIWAQRVFIKWQVLRETEASAKVAMERIVFEVQQARSIYTPTTGPQQLSLETYQGPPSGEANTFTDIFLCSSRVCLKKEGQGVVALTSSEIIVSQLSFEIVGPSDGAKSLYIHLLLDHSRSLNNELYKAPISIETVVTLR